MEGTTTELALRLLILTTVRSYPLRFMHLDQIDGDVWTIPAEPLRGLAKGGSNAIGNLNKAVKKWLANGCPPPKAR